MRFLCIYSVYKKYMYIYGIYVGTYVSNENLPDGIRILNFCG
jgi:hypothetical protein